MSAHHNVKKYKTQAKQLLKQGKLLEARDAYFHAAQLDAKDDRLWAALGEISSRLNHPKDTEAAYRNAVAINPNCADYYLALGRAQAAQKNIVGAEQSYNNYVLLAPNASAGYKALGALARQCGQMEKADQYYQRAMSLSSSDEDGMLEWAGLSRHMGRYEKALAIYQDAQRLNPARWDVYEGLAGVYCDQRRFDLALQSHEQALKQHPEREIDYHGNLAGLYYQSGDWSQALAQCDLALKLNSQHVHARMQRAYILLALGRWQEGWAEHEVRFQHPEWVSKHLTPLVPVPMWQGEELPEATILVEEDQGYGDSFHFCRYLTLLAERCGKVVVRCRPALEQIIKHVAGVAEIIPVTATSANMKIDRYVYMMSLPNLVGPGVDKIYRAEPYLSADPALLEQWRQRISASNLKAGLVWAGSASHGKNAFRSLPLAMFAPLANIEGVTFYGLQKGDAAQQIANAPFPIIDVSAELHDFNHTAAAIAHLDLVITVDTAVAHLAGGMGKPVWTLLYFPPDWRWQREGETTPWYPTMRLFRQDVTCVWEPVMGRVAEELSRWVLQTGGLGGADDFMDA